MNNAISVYFHIPFCVKKCEYCNFCSFPAVSDETVEAYKNALIAQLKAFGDEYGTKNVSTVYFGGGTPTYMTEKQLCEILNSAAKTFKLSSDSEITVEANPKTVNGKQLKILKENGFNRLSLGLQSSNDEMSAFLGRIGTTADFTETFFSARKAGFSNISTDLIFALPHLSPLSSQEILASDLDFIEKLGAEHISIYALSIEDGTPLARKQNSLVFPNDDEQTEMYRFICSRLCKMGYEHYEISNFAKPGYRSRHNTGYWTRREYVGFGIASHSFFENRRFSVKSDLHEYIKNAHSLPYSLSASTASNDVLTEAEAEEERVMLGLRLSDGIVYAVPEKEKYIKMLVAEGYAIRNGNKLSLTEKGFFVSNTIIGGLLK